MAKITYENKVALNVNSDIADVNKCNATDLNEIKEVVNTNDDNMGLLNNLTTPNKNNLVGAINSVVESGSNANGSWIKFSDGTMICTKKVTGQVNIAATWGNLYDTGDNPLDLGDWAIPFIDVPIVSISFYGANGQWVKGFQTSTTKEKIGKISIASATSKTANAYYNVIGIGKWK